ncbi:hypothetical protein COY16_04205 [Candidatus Roizmanbacteria bacterium CG_4_10_14_0_2_um_filter_39_13]|uniref:Lipoprotein n=1 Tax=Candidatus Roizmanbacteria bacterium CG_4_10_14_0_2_um_filter_39_13 TaxID=1974825 RepID=A0A2M7TXE2_9BACT|nr:MAG: hypothetical protein COY16_04205 [Candidatus Roizmanbacteria bacterium CG_4_10_14_0_2_um_filter_39_13]
MYERSSRYIKEQRSRIFFSAIIPALLFLASCGGTVIQNSGSIITIQYPTATPTACIGQIPETITKKGDTFEVITLDGAVVKTKYPDMELEKIHECKLSVVPAETTDSQPWSPDVSYPFSVTVTSP